MSLTDCWLSRSIRTENSWILRKCNSVARYFFCSPFFLLLLCLISYSMSNKTFSFHAIWWVWLCVTDVTFQEIVNLPNSLIKLACLFFFVLFNCFCCCCLVFFYSLVSFGCAWFLIRLPVYRTKLCVHFSCSNGAGVRNGVVVIQVDELQRSKCMLLAIVFGMACACIAQFSFVNSVCALFFIHS